MNRYAIGFPVVLDVNQTKIVLIGAGVEAEHKIDLLSGQGAQIVWIAPGDSEHRASSESIVPIATGYDARHLVGARIVLYAERDPILAAQIYHDASAVGALCWCADDPEHSHFSMPAIARLGAARLAISTAGKSPTLARLFRAQVEAALGEKFARFVEVLGALREEIKAREPDFDKRRAMLLDAVSAFQLELHVRYPDWFEEDRSE